MYFEVAGSVVWPTRWWNTLVNLLEDNDLIKLYGLLPLDFKKFIKLKKEFTNKELRKLLPKRYYNFINVCL